LSARRFLMLVSASAGESLREEVRAGIRPRPEFLALEEDHGVELLDWSDLPRSRGGRGPRTSLAHVAAAMRQLERFDAVLSDGEHVGVPLAAAMTATGRRAPHVVIGHHVTTRAKKAVFRHVVRRLGRSSFTRLVLHSPRQLMLAATQLGLRGDRLSLVLYGVDAGFWSPRGEPEQALIVTAGREHRDFRTLVAACGQLEARVLVAHGSFHSPRARRVDPELWPANFQVGPLDHVSLRDAYGGAALAVVPLVPSDFQAGITTLLEAMAMGKAVVVTATAGLEGLVEDQVTAVTVPPGNAEALHDSVAGLLSNPRERARLGSNARSLVEDRYGLEHYAAGLAAQLHLAASDGRKAEPDAAAAAFPVNSKARSG
jgi:glycosyltransferase involved in cell wall biosynthesis